MDFGPNLGAKKGFSIFPEGFRNFLGGLFEGVLVPLGPKLAPRPPKRAQGLTLTNLGGFLQDFRMGLV